MKKLAKVLSLALVLVMVLSLGGTAWAAETHIVTINKDPTDTATHTYEAYQIFAGTYDAGNSTLMNITWGTGVDSSKLVDALKTEFSSNETASTVVKTPATGSNSAVYYTVGELFDAANSAAKCAEAISELNANHDDATAQKIAAIVGANLSSTISGTGSNTGVSGLADGYYLIKDKDDSLNGKEGAYTRYILEVVNNVEVQEKASVPSVVKKVQDVNDTDGILTGYQDSADYDIGDAVPFQITATTASTVSDYTKYHVTIQDKQSDGLNAPERFTITVLDKTFYMKNDGKFYTDNTFKTEDSSGNTATTENGTIITVSKATLETDQTFAIKVEFKNSTIGSKINVEANNKPIVVEYKSVLNTRAKIGSEGNPNEVYMKYSNNPNAEDDKEGKTPTDKVIVFTYKTVIDKVDKNGVALNGADFTLYKEVPSAVDSATKGSDLTFDDGVEHSAIDANKHYVTVGNKTGNATGATFTFNGIDDGTYVLVETTVPEGYNPWKSAVVTVAATHDTDSADPKLTALTATAPFSTTNLEGGTVTKKDGSTHTCVSGEAYAEIINQQGNVLPTTGGVGTTLFYVFGSILVIAAAVYFVTKKRSEVE